MLDVPFKRRVQKTSKQSLLDPLSCLPAYFRYSGGWDFNTFRPAPVVVYDLKDVKLKPPEGHHSAALSFVEVSKSIYDTGMELPLFWPEISIQNIVKTVDILPN